MAAEFNESELMERVDGDIGFLAETVEMLDTDGRALMADLRRAVAAGDAPAAGRSAHALKGMISNFCSPRAQEAALEVERLGKGGDVAGAPPLLDKLEEMLQSLTAELQQFVKARA